MDFKEIFEQYQETKYIDFILTRHIYSFKTHISENKETNGYSTRTRAEMVNHVVCFNKFLFYAYPSMTSLKDITPTTITMFMRFCKESLMNTNETINRKIRILRHFFNYVKSYYHEIEYNPALEVPYLDERAESAPVAMPKGKLNILLSTLLTFEYGIRDVCITKLLAYTGLLLQEIFDIKPETLI